MIDELRANALQAESQGARIHALARGKLAVALFDEFDDDAEPTLARALSVAASAALLLI